MTAPSRDTARVRRHTRVRRRVAGTGVRPRLCVYRSLRHVYAQVVDDERGATLVSASSLDPEAAVSGANRAAAEAVGRLLGERAKAAGITAVVFDRGGYLYHGRVQALAEAARSAGLEF